MNFSELTLDQYISKNKKVSGKKGKFSHLKTRITKVRADKSKSDRVTKEKKSNNIIMVTNLPESVQNDEVNQIFSKLGKLTRCTVLFDQLGKSKVV